MTSVEIAVHMEEGTFVETSAVKQCIQLLDKNNVLVLTGAAGTGKSRNSLEILRRFKEIHQDYDVFRLTDLNDFIDVMVTDTKTLLLVEDAFGRTNNVFTENTDVKILDSLHARVISGNCKVIFTVRNTIKRSCNWIFSSKRLFHKMDEIDLDAAEFKMSIAEKESLLVKYCEVNNMRIVDIYEIENYRNSEILDNETIVTINKVTVANIVKTDPLLGFPEACCLFTRNRKFTRLGEAFFKHPSQCLTEEIEKLRVLGKTTYLNKMKYITLVYVLLNGDSLDKDQIDLRKIEEIIRSCYHDSQTSFHECDIKDSVDEMMGHYLECRYDTGIYQFQHQTVLESVLLSYSKVNPELILSKLTFEFIREIVRLQNYCVKEGEVVMRICGQHYHKLAQRIIQILQTEFRDRSLSLIQLLFDSELMKAKDPTFIQLLIDESHRHLPMLHTQIVTTYLDRCELVQFYLPAALLEHVVKHKHLTDFLGPILEHMKIIFLTEKRHDILISCKMAVLASFANAINLDYDNLILKPLLNLLLDHNVAENTVEYFSEIIRSLTNETSMKSLLGNVDHRHLDLKAIFFEICRRKWFSILNSMASRSNGKLFNCTGIIQEMCHCEMIDDVKRFIMHHIKSYDLECEIDCCSDETDVLKWLINNVEASHLDLKTALNEASVGGCLQIVHWLLNTFERKQFDMNEAILNGCIGGNLNILSCLLSKVDGLKLNTIQRIARHGKPHAIKWLLKNVQIFALSELTACARKACDMNRKFIAKWLMENGDRTVYDMKTALNKACADGNKELVIWLLQNFSHTIFNVTTSLCEAVNANRTDIVIWLLQNVDTESLDIQTPLNKACRVGDVQKVKLFIENVDHKYINFKTALKEACIAPETHVVKFLVDNTAELINKDFILSIKEGLAMSVSLHTSYDKMMIDLLIHTDQKRFNMADIMVDACTSGSLDVVKWLLQNVTKMSLGIRKAVEETCSINSILRKEILMQILMTCGPDMYYVDELMFQACLYGWTDVVKWILENVHHSLLDVKEVMYKAIYNELTDIVKLILENVDHSLLDVKGVMSDACYNGWTDVVPFKN